MPEQTKQQEDQDASITRSAEFMMEKLATEGQFHYLPKGRGDEEQTITLDNVMEDCDANPEFINDLFQLYKSFKAPLEDFEPEDLGKKLEAFMGVVEELAKGHANFAACDEHGIEI